MISNTTVFPRQPSWGISDANLGHENEPAAERTETYVHPLNVRIHEEVGHPDSHRLFFNSPLSDLTDDRERSERPKRTKNPKIGIGPHALPCQKPFFWKLQHRIHKLGDIFEKLGRLPLRALSCVGIFGGKAIGYIIGSPCLITALILHKLSIHRPIKSYTIEFNTDLESAFDAALHKLDAVEDSKQTIQILTLHFKGLGEHPEYIDDAVIDKLCELGRHVKSVRLEKVRLHEVDVNKLKKRWLFPTKPPEGVGYILQRKPFVPSMTLTIGPEKSSPENNGLLVKKLKKAAKWIEFGTVTFKQPKGCADLDEFDENDFYYNQLNINFYRKSSLSTLEKASLQRQHLSDIRVIDNLLKTHRPSLPPNAVNLKKIIA